MRSSRVELVITSKIHRQGKAFVVKRTNIDRPQTHQEQSVASRIQNLGEFIQFLALPISLFVDQSYIVNTSIKLQEKAKKKKQQQQQHQ
jgi:hypothetical protein